MAAFDKDRVIFVVQTDDALIFDCGLHFRLVDCRRLGDVLDPYATSLSLGLGRFHSEGWLKYKRGSALILEIRLPQQECWRLKICEYFLLLSKKLDEILGNNSAAISAICVLEDLDAQ